MEAAYGVLAHAVLSQIAPVMDDGLGGGHRRAESRDVVARLDALLAAGDFASVQVFHEAEGLLRAELGDTADGLARQIEAFAYDQALATLRAIEWQD